MREVPRHRGDIPSKGGAQPASSGDVAKPLEEIARPPSPSPKDVADLLNKQRAAADTSSERGARPPSSREGARPPTPHELALQLRQAAERRALASRTPEEVPRPSIPKDLARQSRERHTPASTPTEAAAKPTSPGRLAKSATPEAGARSNVPEAAPRSPNPADLARRLAKEQAPTKEADHSVGGKNAEARAISRPPAPREQPSQTERQPASTDATSPQRGSLARQIEGTDLASHGRTGEYLDALSKERTSSLPPALQGIAKEVQSELSKAINDYKNGRGMDADSLKDIVGRIGGPYTMYLRGSYMEHRLTEKTSGAVAELRHMNRLVESGQVSSTIISGAQESGIRGGQQYTLEHKATGKTETISTTPVKEADVLYLGHDGKVHIDEVKRTANALHHTLQHAPDQLQNLVTWRDQAPNKREAMIVLDSPANWTKLFEKIDARRPDSPSAIDSLVTQRMPIQIGDTTFSPRDLAILNRQVQLAQRTSGGTKPDALLQRLSRFSPKDVQQGNFKL